MPIFYLIGYTGAILRIICMITGGHDLYKYGPPFYECRCKKCGKEF